MERLKTREERYRREARVHRCLAGEYRMPLAVDGMKQCTRCGETKPVSEYYILKYKVKNEVRYDSSCKKCLIIKQTVYRKQNSERISQQRAGYYKKNLKSDKPYVYKIIHKPTGHFYFGQTTRIMNVRINEHFNSPGHYATGLSIFLTEENVEKKDLEYEQFFCETVKEAKGLEKKKIIENIDNPLCLNKNPW